jgi:hypothetical protein
MFELTRAGFKIWFFQFKDFGKESFGQPVTPDYFQGPPFPFFPENHLALLDTDPSVPFHSPQNFFEVFFRRRFQDLVNTVFPRFAQGPEKFQYLFSQLDFISPPGINPSLAEFPLSR